MNATVQFIYLCACAVTGAKAAADSVDFDRVWKLSKAQNMTALVASALEGTAAFQNADPSEQKRWSQALGGNLKKSMLFDAERKKLLRFFEAEGIWYLPLKGVILNPLYPCFGTREFADNDILIDPSRTKDAKHYMLTHGFSFRSDDFSADEYSKKPFYNFELHRALVDEGAGNVRYTDYYRDVKDRLIKDEGNACGYHFSDADFYIYFIYHAFKHYDNRGTGFRTLADEYVLLHTDRMKLPFREIEKELTKLGLSEFEQKLRTLADRLFTDPEALEKTIGDLRSEHRSLLIELLSCGTFGTMDKLFQKELAENSEDKSFSKTHYYRRRLFPDISRYQYAHPFIYRHRILYPFFLLYRTAVYPIRHKEYLRQEYKAVRKKQNSTDTK